MKTIGFIGLGVMGLPMSKQLVKPGFQLIVLDLDPSPVSILEQLGASIGRTPEEVSSRTDLLISMLPSPAVTREVLLGKKGAIYGLHPGSIYIDMSTGSPIVTAEIHRALKEKEVEMLDAPVSGGVEGAKAGTLTIIVGGNREILEKIRPVLACMGKKIIHVGKIGDGHKIKLISSMLFTTIMAATAEALVFGKKADIDPEILTEALNISGGRSFVTDNKVKNYILPRDFTPGFAADIQNKNLDQALQLGKELGVPLILATLVKQMYQTLIVKGHGKKDTSIIITLFEEMMGSGEIRGHATGH